MTERFEKKTERKEENAVNQQFSSFSLTWAQRAQGELLGSLGVCRESSTIL